MATLDPTEEKLREQYARLYTAVNNTNHGLALFDSTGRIVVCNDLYARLYRLSPNQVRPGTSADQITRARKAKGIDIIEALLDDSFAADGIDLRSTTDLHMLNDGRRLQTSCQPLWDGGWVSIHEDVTSRIALEQRLAHLAHNDALTDLPNRNQLLEKLKTELGHVPCPSLFVLLLDLDGFKYANDTFGHAFGDEILRIVARRLRRCVRETDFVARLGGDEFTVVLSGVLDGNDVAIVANRIVDALRAPISLRGKHLTIGASIGIAPATDGQTADDILNHADIAMYRAKDAGGNTFCLFDPEMDLAIKARRQLESEVRTAVAAQAFELYYQPLVHLASNRVGCCEALLRWTHPTLGPISPAQFIPIAEEAGLMDELGQWALTRACLDATTWPEHVKVAVNASAVQIRNHTLVKSVRTALTASGLAPERLEIEITESTLMRNVDTTVSALQELRMLGVKIAMDDFGTGYSSLGYLRTFAFDKIKIDRTFVNGLGHDRDALAILSAICALAKSLRVRTTAEGVETSEQLDIVRTLGCTEIQGYIFSPARPLADVQKLVRAPSAALLSPKFAPPAANRTAYGPRVAGITRLRRIAHCRRTKSPTLTTGSGAEAELRG